MTEIHSNYSRWLQESELSYDGAGARSRLLWCLTMSSYNFITTLKTDKKYIAAESANGTGTELLYFFYGRPAFRREQESQRMNPDHPVSLLFDPMITADYKHQIFPFDSSAFQYGLITKSSDFTLDNFRMSCSGNLPERHIAAIFGNEMNYLNQEKSKNIPDYRDHGEVQVLVSALDQFPDSKNGYDPIMAIELQRATGISIATPHLKGVVYPHILSDSPAFKKFLSENESMVAFCCYSALNKSCRAEYYQSSIHDCAVRIHASQVNKTNTDSSL